MTETIHRTTFQVRAVDVDLTGRMQPVALISCLMDSASEHAASGGLAITDLFQKGLTWVLSRFHIQFHRYPKWGAEVEIRTWPSGAESHFALRDFRVSDSKGVVAEATSSWLIVDLKTRRPVRVTEHLSGFPIHRERAIADDFSALPDPARVDGSRDFPIFFSDLDMNRHVTATVYVHRALETVPSEVLFNCRPAAIEVNYRGEAFYGDLLTSCIERVEGDTGACFLHRLTRAGDGRELTLLRTRWSAVSASR